MFYKHKNLSGLQSAIKMIHLIVLAAVRKVCKRSAICMILTWDIVYQPGQLLYVYRQDVMMQCHAQISRKNLPITLKL